MDVIQDIFKTLSLPEFYFAMFRSATPVLLTTLGRHDFFALRHQ